ISTWSVGIGITNRCTRVPVPVKKERKRRPEEEGGEGEYFAIPTLPSTPTDLCVLEYNTSTDIILASTADLPVRRESIYRYSYSALGEYCTLCTGSCPLRHRASFPTPPLEVSQIPLFARSACCLGIGTVLVGKCDYLIAMVYPAVLHAFWCPARTTETGERRVGSPYTASLPPPRMRGVAHVRPIASSNGAMENQVGKSCPTIFLGYPPGPY
ncbi:unnamed protein product, partial [Tuber aestivum]